MRMLMMATLALSVLPACGGDGTWYGDDPELAVTNNGTETVRVKVDDGHDHVYLVSPGQRHVLDLDSFWIDVRITRESDGLLLLDEEFEPGDYDHHDRIEIAVNP